MMSKMIHCLLFLLVSFFFSDHVSAKDHVELTLGSVGAQVNCSSCCDPWMQDFDSGNEQGSLLEGPVFVQDYRGMPYLVADCTFGGYPTSTYPSSSKAEAFADTDRIYVETHASGIAMCHVDGPNYYGWSQSTAVATAETSWVATSPLLVIEFFANEYHNFTPWWSASGATRMMLSGPGGIIIDWASPGPGQKRFEYKDLIVGSQYYLYFQLEVANAVSESNVYASCPNYGSCPPDWECMLYGGSHREILSLEISMPTKASKTVPSVNMLLLNN